MAIVMIALWFKVSKMSSMNRIQHPSMRMQTVDIPHPEVPLACFSVYCLVIDTMVTRMDAKVNDPICDLKMLMVPLNKKLCGKL